MPEPTTARRAAAARLSQEEIRGLVDTKNGTLSARIYSDPDVYALEMERIFARSWLLLGHDSQIPSYGDFVAAYMGEDRVVLIRQRDGSALAWLNQCRHRGNLVCRVDLGNARSFRCPYHGWCYDASGQLVHVPREKEAYKEELDKASWGLVRVPRVETHKGLIFGCWNPDAPSLEDYLGEAAYYLDAFFDRSEGGSEIAALQRWTVQANWKWQAEQHASDMFHASISHVSALSAQMALDKPPPPEAIYEFSPEGYQFTSKRGHGAGFFVGGANPGPSDASAMQSPVTQKYLQEELPAQAKPRLGDFRATEIGLMHMTVFPNLSFVTGVHYLRLWHPRGPDETEVWNFIVVDRDAPQEVKDETVRSATRSFSSAGFLEQDDVDNIAMCQRGVQGFMARKTQLNAQMGIGHPKPHEELPGETSGVFSEEAARHFYGRWQELLLEGGDA